MKSPLDGVLAASYVSPKAVLYGIAVGIAVVGGENSSTSLTTTLQTTAGAYSRMLEITFPHSRKDLLLSFLQSPG